MAFFTNISSKFSHFCGALFKSHSYMHGLFTGGAATEVRQDPSGTARLPETHPFVGPRGLPGLL